MDPYEDIGLRHRLQMAVEYLVSAKPIQQRLIDAYVNHLLPLRTEDFPEHKREDFAALQELFREGPPGPLVMPDEEAEKWTQLIVDLFADLSQGRP